MTSAMSVPIAQVDVFTAIAYGGNPAGVCLLESERDDVWMANVAREMACSNTAFAQARADGDGYDLRWLTGGGVEVALCGHATLATAHVLYERGRLAHDSLARFHTRSGVLVARREGDGGIEMDFPLEVAEPVDAPPHQLVAGLGSELVWVGRNRLDYVAEVSDEAILRALKPDLVLLGEVETRGFVVTARAADSASGYDYVLRFFGPRVGISEDMVTGTAHCALGPYWRDRFRDGRTRFTAYQASARGGLVNVRLEGDRVLIGGKAVTVLRGELLA